MSEVCIVGTGVSGLISAKLCLEQNLIPYIVEKSDSIGGIWKGSKNEVGTWDSLDAHTSKSFSWISDHPWPSSVNEFPTRGDMLDYYKSYATKHGLFQYIHFNTSLVSLGKDEEGYSVTLASEDSSTTRFFKSVILATGFYSKPRDTLPGKERFSGLALHSAYYRDPSIFQGKKVVFVGNAYSSCDIASEACTVAESVSLIYRKKTYFIRKKIHGVPFEFGMFNILSRHHGSSFVTNKADNQEIMKIVEKTYGNPGDVLEELRISDEDLQNHFQDANIHIDEYYECAKNGKIKFIRGCAEEFSENGVVLSDGREVPADVVVVATGYYQDYDFLSEDLRRTLNHDPKLQKNSLLLYRSSIHPALPGLAFVGSFHGPFPGQFEIQSHLAVKWITGQLNVTTEELWEGVRIEEKCRNDLKEATFIYNIGNILQEYFRILGIQIDYEFLDSLGYRNGPYCSVFYWKDRPGQEELIRQYVSEFKATYPDFDFNQVAA